MAELLFDHNVAGLTAALLRRMGHDVLESRRVGLDSAPDDAVLLWAAQHRRILVTHNETDFALLHDAWLRWSRAWDTQQAHAGIVILPQKPQLLEGPAAEELQRFLDGSPLLANGFYSFKRSTGWRQRPGPA